MGQSSPSSHPCGPVFTIFSSLWASLHHLLILVGQSSPSSHPCGPVFTIFSSLWASLHHLLILVGKSSPSCSSTVCFQSYQVSFHIFHVLPSLIEPSSSRHICTNCVKMAAYICTIKKHLYVFLFFSAKIYADSGIGSANSLVSVYSKGGCIPPIPS